MRTLKSYQNFITEKTSKPKYSKEEIEEIKKKAKKMPKKSEEKKPLNEDIEENKQPRSVDDLKHIQAGVYSDDIFADLLDVGSKKALGYLPINTINTYGGQNAKELLIQWTDDNDLRYNLFSDSECDIFGGALIIWDEKMLSNLLTHYATILEQAGVPITTEEYIHYIFNEVVDNSLAYIVIGKTYGDQRFIDIDINANTKITKELMSVINSPTF